MSPVPTETFEVDASWMNDYSKYKKHWLDTRDEWDKVGSEPKPWDSKKPFTLPLTSRIIDIKYILKKGAVIGVENDDGSIHTMIVAENDDITLLETNVEWTQPSMICFLYFPVRYIINPKDIERKEYIKEEPVKKHWYADWETFP